MGDNYGARHNGARKRFNARASRRAGDLTVALALALRDCQDDEFHEDDNDLVDASPRGPEPSGME